MSKTISTTRGAAAAADDKLEGRRPPTRDYGDERQRREMAETADWRR